MENVKKNDFVELKYTGYSNGQVFDSNIEDDLRKLNPKEKPQKTIIIVGQGMLVSGLDRALEGKEIGKSYEVELQPKEAFGERNRDMVRTVPLKVFTEKNMNPRIGMVFAIDNMIAKVLAISGARVTTDFNNPLAGKPVKYTFTIVRKVEDEKERVEAAFGLLFRFVPEFEITDKVTAKGPKQLEIFVNAMKEKFKEFIGKDLAFEFKEAKHEHTHEHSHEGHDHSHESHEHQH